LLPSQLQVVNALKAIENAMMFAPFFNRYQEDQISLFCLFPRGRFFSGRDQTKRHL